MKKSVVVVSLLALGLFAPSGIFAQDLLTNPQNEKYLFTAGSDETQAFLYNPAYLGVHGRGSVLDGYYFFPVRSQLSPAGSFHDFGIFGQGGKFGLAYRNAATGSEDLNEYSFGFGAGNPGASAGAAFSYVNIAGLGTRWFPAVGLLLRPDPHISIGVSYHNFSDRPFGLHFIEKITNIGVGIRPFGTDVLTVNGDLILPSHHRFVYKAGVDLKLLPGLSVYGIYDRSGYGGSELLPGAPSSGAPLYVPPYLLGNAVSFGISFNIGSHMHVEGASSYDYGSGAYAATYGRVVLTSQELSTILPEKRIAEITIRGAIPDGKDFGFFFMKPAKNLLDYVEEIRKCGDDPSIKALILKIYPYSTSETFFALAAETQELADAVKYVRSKGKKVYAYLTEDSGVDEMYLASAADRIYMPPSAFIADYGIDFDLIRLKGLFDKLHITWNAMTAGKYKSTFHTIYTDSATKDQAELIQGLVKNLYSQMIKQIEVNRNTVLDDSVRSDLAGLISANMAERLHLIDGVEYYDQFEKAVKKGLSGEFGPIATADPATMHNRRTRWGIRPEIAVIGVYGDIAMGRSSPPYPFPIPFLGRDRTTGSETVVSQLRAAADDKNVKAIVLRVNSGGGYALAAGEIYNAVREAMEKKPVIASFGNVAASGGYYVAAGAKRIFAEPATLTGSIGVMIAFPVLTDFIEKDLGANVEEYKSGENSSVLNPFHRWSERDRKYIEGFLDETYTDFKTKVAEGRKLSMSRVDELAQGKVYTGEQAKDVSLIDDYGGLEKAIEYAADVAGIADGYRVRMFKVPGFSFGSLMDFGARLLGASSD